MINYISYLCAMFYSVNSGEVHDRSSRVYKLHNFKSSCSKVMSQLVCILLWNISSHIHRVLFYQTCIWLVIVNNRCTFSSFSWMSPPLLLTYSINFSAWFRSSFEASEKNLAKPGSATSDLAKYWAWKYHALNIIRGSLSNSTLTMNTSLDDN